MKKFNCINCGKENKCKPSHYNLYCNISCQHEYRWREILVPKIERGEAAPTSIPVLRRYLQQTRGDKCAMCPATSMWNNNPLTLHVDHIDGDSNNNWPANLRLLCPNCHSQTDNFGSKNVRSEGKRKEYYDRWRRENKPPKEPKPKKEKELKGKRVSVLAHLTKDELEQLIENNTFGAVGKMFNITDNAVRRRCKQLGIQMPGQGGRKQK